ncbi:hypothetical protein SO802_021191 [Lithocarpus litseifolius]|uniref:Uncharacterized protein n=1 Tax=Lithocarpus litseifolius TaxID=425828 RepID=A0AAW2CHM3_9ROSI
MSSLARLLLEGQVDSRHMKSNLGFVEIRDLNRIRHSKVFVHTYKQLRDSHVIIGCTPSYTGFKILETHSEQSTPCCHT